MDKSTDVKDLTGDEFAARLLDAGFVKVDIATGRVWVTRGPAGKTLPEIREIFGSLLNGYLTAGFTLHGVQKYVRLHRFVWVAAHGVPPPGMAVCHRDDVKTNNGIDNLYLATPEQNSSDARATGRYRTGDDHPQSKLPVAEHSRIRQAYRSGGVTLKTLSEQYGVSQSRLSQIIRSEAFDETSDEGN